MLFFFYVDSEFPEELEKRGYKFIRRRENFQNWNPKFENLKIWSILKKTTQNSSFGDHNIGWYILNKLSLSFSSRLRVQQLCFHRSRGCQMLRKFDFALEFPKFRDFQILYSNFGIFPGFGEPANRVFQLPHLSKKSHTKF